jgi:anion-transporting  ArsA/GET3 family ATPase
VSEALIAARGNDLRETVETARVIVCTGSGGVGKTTTAAALALAAARQGRRTIVLTIDPARRLAQSLGLDALDNVPRPVPGVDGLDAMMLDMKSTFDDVIDRHAADPARAQRIKSNKFYRQLSDSMAGTQEYMATEKLYELHQAGAWECIVVDTPPTRNALDFLDAPRRLTNFLEGRFLRLFLAPGMAAGRLTARAAGYGAGVFMRAMGRITGGGVLTDLADFFQSFEGMYEGFKRRAQSVYALLSSPEAAFVVVATPERPALREARYFLERLASEGMPTAGLVINRVTPEALDALGAHDSEEILAAAGRLDDGTPEQCAAGALLRLAVDRAEATVREARTISSALAGVDPRALVEIPLLTSDVHDLDDLTWLGGRLTGREAVVAA